MFFLGARDGRRRNRNCSLFITFHLPACCVSPSAVTKQGASAAHRVLSGLRSTGAERHSSSCTSLPGCVNLAGLFLGPFFPARFVSCLLWCLSWMRPRGWCLAARGMGMGLLPATARSAVAFWQTATVVAVRPRPPRC